MQPGSFGLLLAHHQLKTDCCCLSDDRAAAQSLIRGKDGDVSLGWDMPNHRSAAVLCFDEMQVTDPFAAVALKGQRFSAYVPAYWKSPRSYA